MQPIKYVLVALFLFCLVPTALFAAAPEINFTDPTLLNGSSTAFNFVIVNASIAGQNLSSLIYNWNGTNFTMYNDSLLFMLNLDNNSELGENSTNFSDSSPSSTNVSCSGTSCPNLTLGKYGNAYSFDGVNDFIGRTNANLNFKAGQPHSMAMWIYPLASGTFLSLGSDEDVSGTYTEYLAVQGDLKVELALRQAHGGDWAAISSSNHVSLNTWNYIVGVNDGSTIKIYINGVLGGTSNLGAFSSYPLASNDLYIGELTSVGTSFFNGSIDEVRIWNVSLSQEDVYQQYVSNLKQYNSTQWYLYVNQSKNATAGLDEGVYTFQAFATNTTGDSNITEQRTITVDLNAPIVSIQFPVQGQNLSYNETIWLNFTASDALTGVNLSSCAYSLDAGAPVEIANCANATFNTTEGRHNISINASDIAGNTNVSQLVNFTIDLTNPAVTIETPVLGFNSSSATVDLNYTVSDANAGINYCNYTLDGIVYGAATCANISLTTLTQGTHYINVSVADHSERTNTSSTRTFYVDLTNPAIVLDFPTTNFNTSSSSIDLNLTVSDVNTGVNHCNYTLDGVTGGMGGGCGNGSITDIPAGLHYINVTVTDNSGRTNTSNTSSFRVSLKAPYFNSTYAPVDGYSTYGFSNTFTFTAYDDVFSEVNCSLIIDGSVFASNATVHNNTLTSFPVIIGTGAHTWNITCRNNVGQVNSTAQHSLTVIQQSSDGVTLSKTIPSLSKSFDCKTGELNIFTGVSGLGVKLFSTWDYSYVSKTADSSGKAVFAIAKDGNYEADSISTDGYGVAILGPFKLELCKQVESPVPVEPAVTEEPITPAVPSENPTAETPNYQPTVTKMDALASISSADSAISAAVNSGKDVSAARAKLDEANQALNAGDYVLASKLAMEASELAKNAKASAPATTVNTVVKPAAIAQPVQKTGGFDLVLLLIGAVVLIVIVGLAYYFTKKRGKERSKSHGK